jgi:hypothetical protein
MLVGLAKGFDAARVIAGLAEVRASCLPAAIETIDREFGSFTGGEGRSGCPLDPPSYLPKPGRSNKNNLTSVSVDVRLLRYRLSI